MICLGGYTRLTKAGLSMTKWKAFGYKFPETQEEWEKEFDWYKGTPEYQLTNKGMSLESFKRIFIIEYNHRLLGNIIGGVFGLPLVYFFARGYFTSLMKKRMLLLLGFGGLQGLIGWWMVKSGLKEKPEYQSRPRVSTYRLMIHNFFAVSLYGAILYHALVLLKKKRLTLSVSPANFLKYRGVQKLSVGTIHFFVLNLLSGVAVAGIDAGKVFNTWPLMNGAVVPGDYWNKEKGWKNFFENCSNVQFNHRLFAYLTLISTTLLFIRSKGLHPQVRQAVMLNVALVAWQVANGIHMLIKGVPVHDGVTHQCSAMLFFSSLLLTLVNSKSLVLKVV